MKGQSRKEKAKNKNRNPEWRPGQENHRPKPTHKPRRAARANSESKRSSQPPCPGIHEPLSLTPALRLRADCIRSPAMPTGPANKENQPHPWVGSIPKIRGTGSSRPGCTMPSHPGCPPGSWKEKFWNAGDASPSVCQPEGPHYPTTTRAQRWP